MLPKHARRSDIDYRLVRLGGDGGDEVVLIAVVHNSLDDGPRMGRVVRILDTHWDVEGGRRLHADWVKDLGAEVR